MGIFSLEDMINTIYGFTLFDNVSNLLSLSAIPGGYTAALNVYNAVQPVATVLIYIYFILALLDSVNRESFTFDLFLRQLIQMAIAIYVVNRGFTLIQDIFNLGAGVANLAMEAGSEISESARDFDAATLLQQYKDDLTGIEKVMSSIIIWVRLILPYIACFIMSLCASIVCYSRIIEVYVLAALSPLALADIFKNGMQSNGMRFIKEIFAVALQGAVIIVIARIYCGISLGDPGDSGYIGRVLIAGAAACVTMMKSLSVAKKVVGI